MLKSLSHKLFPKEKLPKGPKQIVLFSACLLIAVLTLFYVGCKIPQQIAFSKTPSLPFRFFYYHDHFEREDLVTGKYIIIPIYSEIVHECDPCMVVKQIGCDEGDHLTVTKEGYYYCGETYLGHAKSYSKKGIPVSHFNYDDIVPAGEFFAIGSCPDSFDSRYIGFLKKENVQAIAMPIF